jgi:hypothetical protein
MDYGNERMNNSACSLDPLRREIRVTALTDEKVLLMVSCEAGAYNTIWLAWLVSRQQPYVARPVRLTLPFQPPGNAERDIELINASIDERRHELVTLDKGRGPGDCGVRPAGAMMASGLAWFAMRSSRSAITGRGQMPGPRYGLPVTYFIRKTDDMLGGEAKEREEFIRWRRFTVASHAHDGAFQPDIFIPVVGDTGLNGNSGADVSRKNRFPICLILRIENIG